MRWLKFIAKLVGRITGFCFLGCLWYGVVYVVTDVCMNIKEVGIVLLIVLVLLAGLAVVIGLICLILKFIEWSFSPPLLEKKK